MPLGGSLVLAIACLLHTSHLVIRFPLENAPSSEFSSTNLGAAPHRCLQVNDCGHFLAATAWACRMRLGCWQMESSNPHSCPQLRSCHPRALAAGSVCAAICFMWLHLAGNQKCGFLLDSFLGRSAPSSDPLSTAIYARSL